ncbi:GGDEF domain-containing protein [Pseudonocardia sp. C8]|nr:GGDEF domain-containing protein [Pseudonocardia sp. C8]
MQLLLLAVELVAVSLVTIDVATSETGDPVPGTPAQWATAAALTVISGLHAEISLRAERLRRRIAETRYIDLSSVWTFSAALLLPPLLAVATVVASYTHLYFRVFRPAGTPPHRQVYSTSTVVLAIYLVAGVRHLFGTHADVASPLAAVVLICCLLTYTAANTLLVVGVIRLAQPGSRFLAILAGGEVGLEIATLSLGGLVATVVVPDHWLLLVLLLPPLILLEQTTLVRQLKAQADTDAKTGLLNADAWRARAHRVLAVAEGGSAAAAVLILDLDHFKDVNDRHGHLVGDAVLQAVAEVVAGEVRDGDAAGRFGGEEFVVVLAPLRTGGDDGAGAVREVGERIRQRVERLRVEIPAQPEPVLVDRLSVSVGAALCPRADTGLDVLLAVADEALYAAKRAGRNRVRVRTTASHPDLRPEPGRPAG